MKWTRFEVPTKSVNRIDKLPYRGPRSVSHCETVLYNENRSNMLDHYPVFNRFVFGK